MDGMQQLRTFSRGLGPLHVVLIGGLVAIFALLFVPYLTSRLGHDQSSYLFEAQRLLAGFEPYGPHLSETNPPLIIWFSAIPVVFARLVNQTPALCLQILVAVMVLASTLWCIRIFRLSSAVTDLLAVGLLGGVVLAVDLCIGTYDFGQREHLLFLLLLPYVFAVATGVMGRLGLAEQCALGIAAGLSLWFKPHDILIVIALELFLLCRTRSFRRVRTASFLALVLTSTLLLVLVLVLTPLYVKQIVPLLSNTYWALGSGTAFQLAVSSHLYPYLVLTTLVAWILLHRFLRDPATSMALILCSLAGSVAYDLQHTNWEYHHYPHRALILVALAYVVIDSMHWLTNKLTSEPNLVRGTMVIASGVTTVALFWVVVHRNTLPYDHSPPPTLEMDQFLSQYKPPVTVYVFSTSVGPLSSVFNQGLTWGGRFAHLWMLPAIIQNELGPAVPPALYKQLPQDTLARLAALQRSASAEDLNYWQPAIVLVQQCTRQDPCLGIGEKNFDMASWFLHSSEFAAAWSHYHRQPGGPNHYELYTRDQ
jgi:hypothetical protein